MVSLSTRSGCCAPPAAGLNTTTIERPSTHTSTGRKDHSYAPRTISAPLLFLRTSSFFGFPYLPLYWKLGWFWRVLVWWVSAGGEQEEVGVVAEAQDPGFPVAFCSQPLAVVTLSVSVPARGDRQHLYREDRGYRVPLGQECDYGQAAIGSEDRGQPPVEQAVTFTVEDVGDAGAEDQIEPFIGQGLEEVPCEQLHPGAG